MKTDVHIQRMYRFETDRPLKAFCDIVVNDALLIKGVRVMEGSKGLFVSMPREQAKDQKWYDTVRCLTEEMRDLITKTCLEAYTEKPYKTEQKQQKQDFNEEIEQRVKEIS